MLGFLYCCWPRCTVNRSRCFKKGGQHVQVHKNQEYVQLYTDVESNYFLLLSLNEKSKSTTGLERNSSSSWLVLNSGMESSSSFSSSSSKSSSSKKPSGRSSLASKTYKKRIKRYDWLRRLNFKKVYFMLIEGLLLWKNQQLE